jgi:serine protease AprX
MKKLFSKLVVVVCGLAALIMFSLNSGQPVSAGQGGPNLAKLDPALIAAYRAKPNGEFRVIVDTNEPDLGSVKGAKLPAALRSQFNAKRSQGAVSRIRALGGKWVNSLTVIGGATATLKASAIIKLTLDPFINFIHLDKKVKVMGGPGDQSQYTKISHAANVWAQGIRGQGVSVAILDSGIAPVDDLVSPTSRIVASVDLVNPNAPGDPGGHGTHVAGIVAGNGTDSAQGRLGVAPGANVVNVRVIGSDGTANLSSVIGGIQWVIQNRKAYNIRVMNLSLGAPATGSYRNDPLAAAVEMAWNSGIVVVAAAGNGGPTPGSIVTPGVDPYIVTVGAIDDNGTLDTSDDVLGSFSSLGPTPDGFHKPDLVAPGRKIVSLRSPGSFLDQLLPDRITDNNYFRLTGTSMSSPVVAGAAALMLQKNPWLKPNQVKGVLLQNTDPFPGTPDSVGAGMVDAYKAVNSVRLGPANGGLTPADNFAKASYPILYGMPLNGIWRDPNYKGIDWSNITWDNITWDRTTWDNITWENITWDNITWTNITWDNITWDSGTWDTPPGGAESGTWDALGDLD